MTVMYTQVKKGDRVSVSLMGNDNRNITGVYADYADKGWITIAEPYGYPEGTVIMIPWHTIRTISWGHVD